MPYYRTRYKFKKKSGYRYPRFQRKRGIINRWKKMYTHNKRVMAVRRFVTGGYKGKVIKRLKKQYVVPKKGNVTAHKKRAKLIVRQFNKRYIRKPPTRMLSWPAYRNEKSARSHYKYYGSPSITKRYYNPKAPVFDMASQYKMLNTRRKYLRLKAFRDS